MIDAVAGIAGNDVCIRCRGTADHVKGRTGIEPYAYAIANTCHGTRTVGTDVVTTDDDQVTADTYAL